MAHGVEAGMVPASPEVFDALQGSLDQLHQMRDVVNRGDRCPPAHELLNRIRALGGHAPLAAPAPAATPTPAPAPTPVAEPIAEPVAEDFGGATGVVPVLTDSLTAEARALQEEAAEAATPALDETDFDIEFDAFLVRYRGAEVRLTHKEFELLRCLVERPGRVLTRDRLIERLSGYESDVDTRSIDAHIRRLRQKLGPARDHVETLVGLGYRFVK